MALGDGIRRNIASVDPTERAALRDALLEMNRRFFPGDRTDAIPGHVTWWFKQDEIHQATHVHGGPEFIPWHREIVNRLEQMLRQINPQLSLHYWDWTQDPRTIPNGNLGGGATGMLTLFTPDFMGYGGSTSTVIGPPWQNAAAPWRSDGYYVPTASPDRDSSGNPADPPTEVNRSVGTDFPTPVKAEDNSAILNAIDFAAMRRLMETQHNNMHGFVSMGGPHISFRDPFVFLLHSNMDRLFARWQTDPAHPERLNPSTVYGSESGNARLNGSIPPWAGSPATIRPFAPPENQQAVKTYKDPSVVTPPPYDTNFATIPGPHFQPSFITNPFLAWLFSHGWEDPGWGRTPAGQIGIATAIHELAARLPDFEIKKQIQLASGKVVASMASRLDPSNSAIAETGVLWESLWESLILSYLDMVGPSEIDGASISFRDIKQQDAHANTFFVQVLRGLKRGEAVPSGFEPVALGQLTLYLFRASDTELKPQWLLDGTPHPDRATKIAFNRTAFPVFLVRP